MKLSQIGPRTYGTIQSAGTAMNIISWSHIDKDEISTALAFQRLIFLLSIDMPLHLSWKSLISPILCRNWKARYFLFLSVKM